MSKNIAIQANIEIDDDQLNGVSGGGVQLSEAEMAAPLAALHVTAGAQATSLPYDRLSTSTMEPIRLSPQTMNVPPKH